MQRKLLNSQRVKRVVNMFELSANYIAEIRSLFFFFCSLFFEISSFLIRSFFERCRFYVHIYIFNFIIRSRLR